MKFGLFFISDNYPAERASVDFYAELLDQVAHAEALGFQSAWFAEHHFRFASILQGCKTQERVPGKLDNTLSTY